MTSDRYKQYWAIRRKTDDEWESVITNLGMAKAQVMVIWTLWTFEKPCTQKEICADWYENKQTINSATKKLIEEGYIDIAPSPENFREKLLTLTEKGKLFAKRTVDKFINAEKRAFEKLTEEEQEFAISISEKYCELLKEEFEKAKGET